MIKRSLYAVGSLLGAALLIGSLTAPGWLIQGSYKGPGDLFTWTAYYSAYWRYTEAAVGPAAVLVMGAQAGGVQNGISAVTSSGTSAGSNVLGFTNNFAICPTNIVGMSGVIDATHPSVIPAGTTVTGCTPPGSASLTLSQNVTGAGVATGDMIVVNGCIVHLGETDCDTWATGLGISNPSTSCTGGPNTCAYVVNSTEINFFAGATVGSGWCSGAGCTISNVIVADLGPCTMPVSPFTTGECFQMAGNISGYSGGTYRTEALTPRTPYLYDITVYTGSSGNCTGPCDLQQPTTSATPFYYSSGGPLSMSQPYFYSPLGSVRFSGIQNFTIGSAASFNAVGLRSSSSSQDTSLIALSNNSVYFKQSSAVWTVDSDAINGAPQSAADNQWHSHTASIQTGSNNVHYNIDGTISTGTKNTDTTPAITTIFGPAGQTTINGFGEGGFIGASAITDPQSASICHQQAGRWPITTSGGNC